VGAAIGWGAIAASSLVLGSLLAIARDWPSGWVALLLAFGAGALISAVSFELAQEGVDAGGALAVGVGFAAGAVTFFLLDGLIERRSGPRRGESAAATPLALGAFLDGVPEQLVLGLGLAGGQSVSAGLLVAIFVSNLPESAGSASAMRAAGREPAKIVRLWLAVAIVCVLASGIGYAAGDSVSGSLEGGFDGFAAGALLVMLADSMIPEARKAGRASGLVTALGFAVAAALSQAS
jgi:ZIP family zinc transporter